MKKVSILYYVCALALFAFAINPMHVYADGGCLTLNNGGPTKQQVCLTPIPTPTISVAPLINNQQQNTPTQPVYAPSKTKSTPNTGPADWSLPALLFLGGIGLLLQNKSRHSFKAKT